MRKILPLNKPYITHTPESSFLFSLLDGIPTADEWICSRLLSMVVRRVNIHDEFSMIGKYFYECPFLHIIDIKNEVVKDILSLDFSDIIVKAVDSGYYISAMVNTKYIDNYAVNYVYHHHIHVFGYDLDEQTAYICDHFRNGFFTFEKCSFSEINHSRFDISSNIDFVKLLSKVRFNLTAEAIVSLINEHIKGENLFDKYMENDVINHDINTSEYFFGLKFYDCLSEILETGRFPYRRPFVLIYEHTKIIKMLMYVVKRKFLLDIDNLIELCDDLTMGAELLKNYYLKVSFVNNFNDADYNILENAEQRNKIINILKTLKEKEYVIFERFLLLLDKVLCEKCNI